MLKLFIKDNTNGCVHEYGTDCHDALILQEDGSLHYENLQTMCGTMFPDEGYSFCSPDGEIPKWDLKNGIEPYIDIAGEYYTKPKTNADRIRAMTDEELAHELALVAGWDREQYKKAKAIGIEKVILNILQQPAEGD